MKSKYYIGDETLVDYCKKHPEIRYDQLTKYISIKLKEDPTRDPNEIISEFIKKSHRRNTRYIINGMNLSRYCELMGINYCAVTKEISRAKKDKRYSGMTEEEIINKILEKRLAGNAEELVFDEAKKLILKPDNDDEKD